MSTYQEAMQTTLAYFGGNDLPANTVVSKYLLKTKLGDYLETSPQQLLERMAREFARIETKFGGDRALSYDRILGQFDRFSKIIPQGSPQYGIGNNEQIISLSNCVVVGPPQDNIPSIMDKGKDLACLFTRRTGVGVDLSSLRPENTPVSNSAGSTSGAWSFADFYSYICRMIGQNGRRGAEMISLDVKHPDIFKFVSMKANLDKVTGANISVKIRDDFMEAVVADAEYTLQFPVDSINPTYTKVIKARELWDHIVAHATKSAEPGLLFWDTILRSLPAECYASVGFKTEGVNPCKPLRSLILTPDGYRTFQQMIDASPNETDTIEVLDSKGVVHRASKPFKTGENRAVSRVLLSNGTYLYGTPEHTHMDVMGKWIPISDMKVGTQLKYEMPTIHNTLVDDEQDYWDGVLCGWVYGDGWYFKSGKDNQYTIGMCFGNHEFDVANLFENKFGIQTQPHAQKSETCRVWRTKTKKWKDIMDGHGYNMDKSDLTWLYKKDKNFKLGFLKACFTADGSVRKKNNVEVYSIHRDALCVLSSILQEFGIYSTVAIHNYAKSYVAKDGKVRNNKDCWKLNVYAGQFTQIGFLSERKNALLSVQSQTDIYRREGFVTVFGVEPEYSVEDVYDITVESDEHAFIDTGVITHNCAELALSADDSCRLITLNLLGFVRNAFTTDAYFDFDAFRESVSIAMRLSDDLVELEIEKLQKLIAHVDTEHEKALWGRLLNSCIKGRRTGLGTLGLGDTLLMMGITYGSDESLPFVESIYEAMRDAAYLESAMMAKERGAFPVYDYEKEIGHMFISALPVVTQNMMRDTGRRNISLLTGAPTGSCAMEASFYMNNRYYHNVTSGIESVFRYKYTRRKKINPSDIDAKVDFVDEMGDKWSEYDVYHSALQAYYDMHGLGAELPKCFVASDNIDWIGGVKTQAAIQKYTDHSLSRTCNLPTGTTPDLVSDIYIEAWKLGLKGVTVYVDGSRSGVLVTEKDKKPTSIPVVDAPKRPDTLPCEIHHRVIKPTNKEATQWTILVGLLDGKPYEVFAGPAEYIEIPEKYTSGSLIKHERKTMNARYDLTYGENGATTTVKNIIKWFEDVGQYGTMSRFISMSLRHGVPVQYVVEQLQKDESDDMWSFNRVVARVLKTHIPDGVAASDKTCSSCKQPSLVYQDGCVVCTSCAHSKCG